MDQARCKRIDLTGHQCPYPFTKSLLALEKMATGELLEVLIDYQPALQSTPRSLAAYGHQVIEVRTERKGWTLVIRKGAPPRWS